MIHTNSKKDGVVKSPVELPVVARVRQPLQEPPFLASAEFVAPGSDGAGSPSERRSSRRLVTKQNRDLQRFFIDDDEDAALEEFRGMEVLESKGKLLADHHPGAASSGAAAMTVPLTADGRPALHLWDMISDRQLAMLALELSQLAMDALPGGGAPLDDATENSAKHASGDASVALPPESRVNLIQWLENQARVLTEQLGCHIKLPILGLRRDPAGITRGKDGVEENQHEEVNDVDGAGRHHNETGTCNNTDPNKRLDTEIGPPAPTEVALPSSGFLHPYTELMLKSTVPAHIRHAAVDPLPHDPLLLRPTPSAGMVGAAQSGGGTGTVTPAGLATPTPSSMGGGGGGGEVHRPESSLPAVDSVPSVSEAPFEDHGDEDGLQDGDVNQQQGSSLCR